MPTRLCHGTVVVVAAALPAGPGQVARAQAPAPPPHYAIRNARIVTGAGAVIERGTLVMHKGVITAVGASAAVPAGAWEIDGTGLTVYPGLIDPLSTVALPSAMRLPRAGRGGQAGGGGGGGGGGQQAGAEGEYSRGPEDRPGTFTWQSAADDPDVGDSAIARWRRAGYTSVVAVSERGWFPGQAAVLNLAGDRAGAMVVATPVAQRVNLQSGPGFPGYPNSLMGAIAYVKQVFFDAAYYDRAWTAYEAAPAGKARPAYDRTLEPLRRALGGRMPVLYPATLDKEIRRALDMAGETGTAPVVYGAHEGYRSAALLAERKTPVLVSVNWPAAPRDGDPDAEPPLSTLRLREHAPTTPAAFEKAGVRFALYAGGADPQETMGNVRKAIALGLTPDAALRAMTRTPAEIFGVGNRLGTIEVGKIANVLVTDGPLFGDSTKVKMVFVDGRQYEGAPPAVASADSAPRRRRTSAEVGPIVPMTEDRGPYAANRVTLIRNATIMTVTNGTIENGSILIRDGKIAAVGKDITAPAGATIVDASGKYVTPGMIDAHSHIATDAVNEGSVAVSAMVGIEDVLDPDDVGIYRALAGGVTSVNVLHGSANPIGGKNAVIKLRWGADARGLLLQGAAPGVKFALGENTKRDRNPDRYPATRMGVQDVIRQAFLEARQYSAEWTAYRALPERDRRAAVAPRRDLELEALAEILDGTRLVHAHSYRADEILQLIRLAEEFGFRIATFQHVLEGYKVADEIAAHGAGASTFSDWWAYKVEAYEAIPHNAALMTERGVVSSINSDSPEEMRHLNQEAAKTMKWGGLSEADALKLVTLNPATQLRVQDRVGSIEVGKDADLTVFSGHPLSVMGMVEQTYVDGQLYFDRALDRLRQQQREAERKALMEKEKKETPAGERPRVTTAPEEN
jgi:imidazolonepropionase-like amidohydrolase